MLKTPLGDIPMSKNLLRAIFHNTEIWLADRYGVSKPDWLNFQVVKTSLDEIPIYNNLWSNDVQNVI